MSRMFDVVSETWNPVIGCLHYCKYCWAMRLVERKLRFATDKYRDGFFRPKIIEKEFRKKFRPNTLVFVCDMGDLFGEWVEDSWIERVLSHIAKFPKTTFLLLTKNPYRYRFFMDSMPRNVLLGATIETNIDSISMSYSNAPSVSARIVSMIYLAEKYPDYKRMIAIEPIMKFDDRFIDFIIIIRPSLVYVGYDNYNNHLPEPPLWKTKNLINRLRNAGITVRVKTLRDV